MKNSILAGFENFDVQTGLHFEKPDLDSTFYLDLMLVYILLIN